MTMLTTTASSLPSAFGELFFVFGIWGVLLFGSAIKKAFKVFAVVLLCGLLFLLAKPTITQILAHNGITVEGTVITIEVENEEEPRVIDLSMGVTVDTKEQWDGSYKVVVNIPENEPQEFTVSKKVASIIKLCAKFIQEAQSIGVDIANKYLPGDEANAPA